MLQTMTLLLMCQLAGEVTVRILVLDVPGPVLGMLLLFMLLLVIRRLPEPVEATASTLLGHLSLLFVPAGVGVMSHMNRLGDEWLPIVVALLGSTLIALVVTGGILRLWLQREQSDE